MTQRRKAELQRKLSMAPVPKPPEDLAKRIKKDIPEFLSEPRQRERLSPPFAFTLRVAASIVLLVGSVFLTIQLMQRDEPSRMVLEPTEARERFAEADAPAPANALPAEPQVAEGAVAAGPSPAAPQPRPRPRRVAAPEPVAQSADRQAYQESPAAPVSEAFNAVARDAASAPRAEVGSIAAAAPPPPPPYPAEETRVADARMDAAPRPPAAAAAPVAGRTPSRTEAITVTSLAQKQSETPAPFGVSVDPGGFQRARELIERRERPAAGAIDVAAIINHFAAPSEPVARRAINLEVEASRAPLGGASGPSLIRYSVDSGIAAPAELSVRLEQAALVDHRVVSPGAVLGSSRAVLAPKQSVTGVIEVNASPSVKDDELVATLTLRYRSPSGPETLTRAIRARDLRADWAAASRRHRLATLSAVWSESLVNGTSSGEIARAAEALAEEAPGDDLSKDLAAAATASARLRSSGPTGSEE